MNRKQFIHRNGRLNRGSVWMLLLIFLMVAGIVGIYFYMSYLRGKDNASHSQQIPEAFQDDYEQFIHIYAQGQKDGIDELGKMEQNLALRTVNLVTALNKMGKEPGKNPEFERINKLLVEVRAIREEMERNLRSVFFKYVAERETGVQEMLKKEIGQALAKDHFAIQDMQKRYQNFEREMQQR